jgi:putative aldouronate transport system substrate-binding protein
MFTCNWANNFYNNVSNGVLVALDDLLPTNAPKYWTSIKPGIWDAAKVSGVLYGAINQQIWASVNGFDFRKDLIDKYNWDPNTLKTYEGVEKYWETIKKNEPDIYPSGWFSENESPTWWASYYGLDGISPVSMVKVTDETRKQMLGFETPEFKEAVEIAYRWVDKGYLPPEPTKSEDFQTNMKAGQYSAVPSNWAKPGRAGEDKAKYGFDFVSVPMDVLTPPFISTSTIVPTMNGIAKTCKDTALTSQLLELMNTDVDVYTMLCKGIEGKHWVWVDKAMNLIGFPEGTTAENTTYNPNTDWMFGNQFNAPYVDRTQAESKAWEETKALNDGAVVSVMMGFAFVNDPVQTEIAQVDPVSKELGQPLSQGLVDPGKIGELVTKMKEAGADKIMEEAQKQMDEWLKSKK